MNNLLYLLPLLACFIPTVMGTLIEQEVIIENISITHLKQSNVLSSGLQLENYTSTCVNQSIADSGLNTTLLDFSANTINALSPAGLATACVNYFVNEIVDVFQSTVFFQMNRCQYTGYSVNMAVPCGSDSIGNDTIRCGLFKDETDAKYIWLADALNSDTWDGKLYLDDITSNIVIPRQLVVCPNELTIVDNNSTNVNGSGQDTNGNTSSAKSTYAIPVVNAFMMMGMFSVVMMFL